MKYGIINEALAVLNEGGLVVIPTETFYGIACDARSAEAVSRLVQIKGREGGKPIPLIAGTTGAVKKCASSLPHRFQSLADRFWPGPLTLILNAARNFPSPITAETGTVGIRVPGQSFALDLAQAFSGPVTATSANRVGQTPARKVNELDAFLVQRIDLVVDGGTTPGDEPSTILDLTTDPPEILRPGVLFEEVSGFLKKL